MGHMMKNGANGQEVRALQEKLVRLGYDLKPDGQFGNQTEKTVKELQRAFGYNIDGIVGDATTSLIDAQIGYGWSAKLPDAEERALRAQGKNAEADALKAKREAGGAAKSASNVSSAMKK